MNEIVLSVQAGHKVWKSVWASHKTLILSSSRWIMWDLSLSVHSKRHTVRNIFVKTLNKR